MEAKEKNDCGYFIVPSEKELKAAERTLYNSQQIEKVVCDYFGITRCCLFDNSMYADVFYQKYKCDLLYDVLNKKSPLYLGGEILKQFKHHIKHCEEQEAWYLAADEVLSKHFF